MLPTIDSLNLHHLRYFWCVVSEGGILAASRRLRVSHPTISAQLRAFEEQLGVALFDRHGRSLELTEAGRVAFRHADRMLAQGRDLLAAVQAGSDRPRLRIGVTDDLPKLFVRRLLEPVFAAEQRPRLVLEEERHTTLLGRLAVRELDLVLSDAPAPPQLRMGATDRLLGSSGSSFLAAPKLARRLRPRFPQSLDGAPFLGPLAESQLGRVLSEWLGRESLVPELVAEVADSALLKTLAQDGLGVIAVPTVAEAPAIEAFGVRVVGRVDELRVPFHATTMGAPDPGDWIGRLVEHGRSLFEGTPPSAATP